MEENQFNLFLVQILRSRQMKNVFGSIALVGSEIQHSIPLDGRNPALAVELEQRLLARLKTGGDH
jgi:hypothetical protein